MLERWFVLHLLYQQVRLRLLDVIEDVLLPILDTGHLGSDLEALLAQTFCLILEPFAKVLQGSLPSFLRISFSSSEKSSNEGIIATICNRAPLALGSAAAEIIAEDLRSARWVTRNSRWYWLMI